ncbi:MAG: hypothetical protein R6X35_14560 [Candidatus Krumholzibacteriia bacterium]
MRIWIFGAVLTASLLGAGLASAQCSISGDIVAGPSGDPLLPAWEYTLTVTWDTGTPYALSHVDLLLDAVGGTCFCADFAASLLLVNPAGSSDGVGGCTVPYDVHLECSGDPSIPGVDGILLKFEPAEGDCEPANTGTAVFVFYSDLDPVPVDEDILSLVDKYATEHCFGNLSGEFPGMACNPVPDAGAAWGTVKGLYR